MSKKANLFLNIIELFSMIFISFCFILSLSFDLDLGLISGIKYIEIIKNIILYSSLFFMFILVSIEFFLFLNYKLRFKLTYIGYLLLDLFFVLYINKIYNFSGIIILGLFCIIKFILRICLVNNLYIPDEVYRYLDLYHISYSKPIKKKVPSKKINTIKVTSKEKDIKSTSVNRKNKNVATA